MTSAPDTSGALLPAKLSSQLGAGHFKPDTFLIFLACFSQLPKLSTLLRWSFICLNVYIRSTNIWISYIHFISFQFHPRVYYELTSDQLLVGLIAQLVRVLHWYCRAHAFHSRLSLNFLRLAFLDCLSWVHYCDDCTLHPAPVSIPHSTWWVGPSLTALNQSGLICLLEVSLILLIWYVWVWWNNAGWLEYCWGGSSGV